MNCSFVQLYILCGFFILYFQVAAIANGAKVAKKDSSDEESSGESSDSDSDEPKKAQVVKVVSSLIASLCGGV